MAEEVEQRIYHNFQTIYVLLDDGDRRVLKEVGLTPTQFNLLNALADETNYPHGRSQTTLADILLCTRGNITRLVRRLESNGLVQLNKDTHDQRVIRVQLTDNGRAQLTAAQSAMHTAVANRFQQLDSSAQEQLADLTAQIIADLESNLHSDL